jgi:hypothetical protein
VLEGLPSAQADDRGVGHIAGAVLGGVAVDQQLARLVDGVDDPVPDSATPQTVHRFGGVSLSNRPMRFAMVNLTAALARLEARDGSGLPLAPLRDSPPLASPPSRLQWGSRGLNLDRIWRLSVL